MTQKKTGALALLAFMFMAPLQLSADTSNDSMVGTGNASSASMPTAAEVTKTPALSLSLPAENSAPATEKKSVTLPAGSDSQIKAVADQPATEKKLQLSLREEPKKKTRPRVKLYSPPTLKAVVNINDQRMRVYVNGQLEHTWKVSTARRGYVTPNGTFKPQWLSRMHYSRQYDNSPMPYSVFFHKGYATHGTASVSRLGRPASHGCVRLHTDNARKFFNLVRKHGKSKSTIVVVGSSPSYGDSSRLAYRSNYGTRYSYGGNGRVQESFSIFGFRDRNRGSRRARTNSSRSTPSFLSH